jgi:ABC-2 type transport system permease protein
MIVVALVLGAIINALTKKKNLAFGVSIVLIAALLIAFYINTDSFKGLLPSVMTTLSLFERFNTFVNGVFDMTAVVYFLSVAAFFIFLSVQSLEKRRYN